MPRISAAALSITGNADSKSYGDTKTYGGGSAAYSITGGTSLKNSDAIAMLDGLLQPATTALASLPVVVLAESASFYLRQGQAVLVAHAPTAGLVQLHTASGELLGVGEILDDGRIAPRRLVNQQLSIQEASGHEANALKNGAAAD